MRLRHALVPLGFAIAIAAVPTAPTLAAPLHSALAQLTHAVPQDATPVHYKKRKHYHRRHVRGHYGPRYYDNVGSIVRTPGAPYYAYNRWSGQYHRSCVIDLGYGRTQPCDAGGASR